MKEMFAKDKYYYFNPDEYIWEQTTKNFLIFLMINFFEKFIKIYLKCLDEGSPEIQKIHKLALNFNDGVYVRRVFSFSLVT